MSAEICYLVCSAGLCGILWLPYLVERVFNQGLIDTAGYPEKIAEPAKWAQRSKLAHINMLENLPIFAILIIFSINIYNNYLPHYLFNKLILSSDKIT